MWGLTCRKMSPFLKEYRNTTRQKPWCVFHKNVVTTICSQTCMRKLTLFQKPAGMWKGKATEYAATPGRSFCAYFFASAFLRSSSALRSFSFFWYSSNSAPSSRTRFRTWYDRKTTTWNASRDVHKFPGKSHQTRRRNVGCVEWWLCDFLAFHNFLPMICPVIQRMPFWESATMRKQWRGGGWSDPIQASAYTCSSFNSCFSYWNLVAFCDWLIFWKQTTFVA